jgi:hypothetical protein
MCLAEKAGERSRGSEGSVDFGACLHGGLVAMDGVSREDGIIGVWLLLMVVTELRKRRGLLLQSRGWVCDKAM